MNQRIPPSFIQEVLTHNDIVEIVRSRVSLTQRGDNYVARCPFHEEKTPSFNVSHSKQFYYCFGCSASGNAIGFLIAFDHMTFPEAVAHLAARAGLEMPSSSSPEDVQRYAMLHQVSDRAAQYYCMTLRHHPTAIQYLKSRGITGAIAKVFNIGYASASWQGLQEHIGVHSEQQAALVESGLVIAKEEGRRYDRFRDRIMFPIRNIQGQIIGFGGRTLGNAQPKYLNSPETPLFHKGAELYGLHEVRRSSDQFTRLVVVEGYMDVIALHQHGITCAVATLGTAVTAKQVQKCLRYVNELIFCFDGDSAGRRAAWKALTISLPLLREGVHIHFLFLPEQEDPDSLVRKIGAEAFSQLLEQAPPLHEIFFTELKNQIPLDSPANKAHFGQQAAQYLNTMPQGLFRQLMYEQLASELQTDTHTLTDLLQPPPPKAATTRASTTPRGPGRQLPQPLHLAISLLLHQPALVEVVPDDIELSLPDVPEKNLFTQIVSTFRQQPELTTGELLARIEQPEAQQLVAQLAARQSTIPPEGMKAEFLGTLMNIEQQARDQHINALIEKAKKSELNLEEKRKLQTLLTKLKVGVPHLVYRAD